jgi:hypothetical protein
MAREEAVPPAPGLRRFFAKAVRFHLRSQLLIPLPVLGPLFFRCR